MKQKIALLLCLVLVASLFAGCANDEKAYVPTGSALVMEDEIVVETEPPKVQDLTMAYYPEKSMNPLNATDFTNRTLFSLMYQGLFSVSDNYQAVPILCSSFRVSPNNKTYVYYLEDATFSDGTPVTAEDVIATYEAARKSKFYGGRFSYLHSVTINDDGGICFALTTPYENFSLLLDVPILKASEVDAERPLGTGPYSLEESLSGTHLRKNMNWWCGNVTLAATAESIVLIEAENASFIRDNFEFYDIGLVCSNPCSGTYADYRCDYEHWDCDTGIMLYLGFNVNYSQDGIFEDPDLRSAMTYAIDRQLINEKYYNGYAKVASLPAEPGTPYYSESLAERYSYDSLRFIQVLSQTKLPKDPIVLIVNSDDSVRLAVANHIAEVLTDYGMRIEVKAYSSTNYRSVFISGHYDMYLGQVKLSPNMDLSEFFRTYGELARNGTAHQALLGRCTDALANTGNYSNLHQQVMDDGRICPILFHSYAIYATRGLVTDMHPSRDNVFFYSIGKTLAGIQQETEYG